MRLLDNLSLRLYIILCMIFWKIRLWAQDDDDDFLPDFSRGRNNTDNPFDMDEAMGNYPSFHIRLSDVIWIVVLIVSCYFFRKIWKGCSYLLIAFAVLMYFMTRF